MKPDSYRKAIALIGMRYREAIRTFEFGSAVTTGKHEPVVAETDWQEAGADCWKSPDNHPNGYGYAEGAGWRVWGADRNEFVLLQLLFEG